MGGANLRTRKKESPQECNLHLKKKHGSKEPIDCTNDFVHLPRDTFLVSAQSDGIIMIRRKATCLLSGGDAALGSCIRHSPVTGARWSTLLVFPVPTAPRFRGLHPHRQQQQAQPESRLAESVLSALSMHGEHWHLSAFRLDWSSDDLPERKHDHICRGHGRGLVPVSL